MLALSSDSRQTDSGSVRAKGDLLVKYEQLTPSHLVRVETSEPDLIYIRVNPDGLSWGAIEAFGYSATHALENLRSLVNHASVFLVQTRLRPPKLFEWFEAFSANEKN